MRQAHAKKLYTSIQRYRKMSTLDAGVHVWVVWDECLLGFDIGRDIALGYGHAVIG
jgi:hypothetical protein